MMILDPRSPRPETRLNLDREGQPDAELRIQLRRVRARVFAKRGSPLGLLDLREHHPTIHKETPPCLKPLASPLP
jgi:hypothetical protein